MREQPAQNAPGAGSLACGAGERAPAFELKFLVSAGIAAEVQAWARSTLGLGADPHADETGAYATTTLYLDTPELDVYRRSPTYRRRKFRIRRYGAGPQVFLERKTKSNDRVSKRRAAIGEAAVSALALPMSLETWTGHWFHRRVVLKRLVPACRVAYRRTALVGACSEGPLRLTLDHELRGMLSSEWRLTALEAGVPLVPAWVILELKFLRALPAPFKRLVDRFRLTPAPASKYRLCRDACGMVAQGPGTAEGAALA